MINPKPVLLSTQDRCYVCYQNIGKIAKRLFLHFPATTYSFKFNLIK